MASCSESTADDPCGRRPLAAEPDSMARMGAISMRSAIASTSCRAAFTSGITSSFGSHSQPLRVAHVATVFVLAARALRSSSASSSRRTSSATPSRTHARPSSGRSSPSAMMGDDVSMDAYDQPESRPPGVGPPLASARTAFSQPLRASRSACTSLASSTSSRRPADAAPSTRETPPHELATSHWAAASASRSLTVRTACASSLGRLGPGRGKRTIWLRACCTAADDTPAADQPPPAR